MAYQNVGKPRFFIDNYQYLRAMGLDPTSYIAEDTPAGWGDALFKDNQGGKTPFDNPSAFTLDPTQAKAFINTANDGLGTEAIRFHIPCGERVGGFNFSENMKWYVAVLNHNINDSGIDNDGDVGARFQNIMFMSEISGEADSFIGDNISDGNMTPILNTHSSRPDHKNGTSIWYTDLVPSENWTPRYSGFQITTDYDGSLPTFSCGAISAGVMYTMPHSPDLSLSMTIENDGYKSVTTSGGSTLTNINYTGSPNWSNTGGFIQPFGVGDYSEDSYLGGAKRNGRRNWTLKLSYISDKDLFSSNYMMNNYTETTTDYDSDDIDTENQFEYNIFTDDSFVAQVWNKTCGGALPFIFQPDSSNDNPDQFCLAQFDQNSLKISQVAYQTYNISVKITEVW